MLTALPLILVALARLLEPVQFVLATRLRDLCLQALLQAHTEQLEQQNQAHVQQLLVQHASELHSRAAALTAQQQQLHADAEKAASKHAVDVTQRQQLLERSNALLAAEKQKTTALKVGQSDVNALCILQNANQGFEDFAVELSM